MKRFLAGLLALTLMVGPAFAGSVTTTGAGKKATAGGGSALIDLTFTSAQTPESGGFTVARALAAWAQKADNSWQSFASNASRTTTKGLLIEGVVENELLQSVALTTSPWSGATACGSTLTTTATAAPDGSSSAYIYNDGACGGAQDRSFGQLESFVGGSTTINHSVYLKDNGLRYMVAGATSQGIGSGVNIYIDLSTNATTAQDVSTDTHSNVLVQDAGNGWVRLSWTQGHTGGGSGFSYTGVGGSDALQNRSYAGFGASAYVWMPSAEYSLGFVSSPISTTTANVTRPADIISQSLAIPSSFTMDAGFTVTRATGTTRTLAEWNDGTAANRMVLQLNTSGCAQLVVYNSSSPTTIATEGSCTEVRSATATAVKAGTTWTLKVNGSTVGSPGTATAPTATTLRLGSSVSTLNALNDYLTSFKVQ